MITTTRFGATARAARRTSLAVVDKLSYSPIARSALTVGMTAALSNPPLINRMRPVADWAITRTSAAVPGTRVERVAGPLRGDWVRAPGTAQGAGVVLVLHGSGYLICSARTHRGFASHLSRYSGMPALVIDYRLAPDHPFPAAEDDAMAAYRWLLAEGHPPHRVVVAGDSAGGHLAVAMALRARSEGLPAPAALALFAPLIDPAYRAAFADRRIRRQPLDPRVAARAVGLYVGGHDVDDPRLCLLNADLSGLPPTQLHYGTRELMRADAEAFAGRMIASGVRCDERVWPGLIHGYWLWPRDHGRTSLKTAGMFLRTAVAEAGTAS
jgi:monoterpene epsilon-lactone hydrolase